MQDRLARIENYRLRAEELRALAESMKSEEAREMTLHIAADYLLMAEKLEANPEKGGTDSV